MVNNPQNPYVSFVVAASAGSGKTYQLSRRFLFLIGAGAEPGEALTVTFTKKAAGEMRQRILQEAARLKADAAARAAFDAELLAFFRAAGGPSRLPLPRTAAEVADSILAASQQLKVSTIDSLFLEWVSKFPFEAQGDGAELPTPFDLADPRETRATDEQAFRALCQVLSRGLARGDADVQALVDSIEGGRILSAEDRLKGLDRQDTFLWYAEARRPEGSALLEHPTAAGGSEAELWEDVTDSLETLAFQMNDEGRRERCLFGIRARDLEALRAAGLLTAQYTVSGTFFRGKKREALEAEIALVEAALLARLDRERLEGLNRVGRGNYGLYRVYRALRDRLKHDKGQVEFRDLVKGAYRIFHGATGAGVRFLLAHTVRHLLLDEFQDTSRLQWAIFQSVAGQLLELDGQGMERRAGPPATVFLVGDAKQSIYGFREADPEVIGDALTHLGDKVLTAPLNESYRTAQVVLDLVNSAATGMNLKDFAPHATARAGDRPFVPDVGRVIMTPLLDDEDEDELAEEKEAELVARTLRLALDGLLPSPVFDKEAKGYRPLRAGDVALLYRSSTKANLFEQALRRAGIACQREEERGFFARAEVADAAALLRHLAFPQDAAALAQVLKSPLAQASDDDLMEILAETQAADLRGAALLRALSRLDAGLAETLAWLKSQTDRVLPHEILCHALARLNAFSAYARAEFYASADAELAQRNLLRLVEIVMGLEERGLSTMTAVSRRLSELAQDDELGNAQANADAVTLMTIHKSKGLEFPWICLVDTGRPWGKVDSYWIQSPAGAAEPGVYYTGTRPDRPLADAAFRSLYVSGEDAQIAEAERLLYVALTRPKQYLMISGHVAGSPQGLAATAPYQMLAAAMGAATTREEEVLVVRGEQLRVWNAGLENEVLSSRAPVDEAPRRAPRLGDRAGLPREIRVVAPSHEEGFGAADPMLRVKAVADGRAAKARGDLLHRGLEAMVKQGAAFDAGAFPDVARELERLHADPERRRLVEGARRVESEMPLVHRDGDTLVSGTLDLLVERSDGTLVVVDYKTTEFEGEAPTDALRRFADRRGYKKQLAAYARAVAAMHPGRKVETGIYFTSIGKYVEV